MNVFVAGQERTGTHTLCKMLQASGIDCLHETNPTLCKEAYDRVVYGKWNNDKVIEKINLLKGKSEANHRLQFFVDVISEKMPNAKFIFLNRDSVEIVTSLLATFAHWGHLREIFPNWYIKLSNVYVPQNKQEFNYYRIPAEDKIESLPILHLRSLIRGLLISLPLLSKLKNLKIINVKSDLKELWDWLELPWTKKVEEISKVKADSMDLLFGKDNLSIWAKEQVKPYIKQIREEFNSSLIGIPLAEEIIV